MSTGDITHVVTCTVPELMIYHAKAIAAKDAEIERLRARVAELERELAKPKAAHSTSDIGHVIMRGENERS